MVEKYLLDTNIVISFSENKFTEKAKSFIAGQIDGHPHFSVISKIELLSVSETRNEIIELIQSSTIIGLTDAIIDKTISLRKAYKIKTPDAIIAATAIVEGRILITNDIKDFQGIKGLKVLYPKDL